MRVRVRVLRAPPGERGQALVLSALCLLLLALLLMLSFNLDQVIHERIRLQQHADAAAYSLAVTEARAFNYLAYSNRAQAAALVAMNSLDADVAAMSVTAEMFKAAHLNFLVIMAEEFGQCNVYQPQHCLHGAEALSIAGKFSDAQSDYEDRIRGMEQPFETAAQALDVMLDTLHASQLAMVADTTDSVRGGAVLEALRQVNAPQAQAIPPEVATLNVAALSCAVDGMPCSRSGASDDARAKVLTAVANGSRPAWAADRSGFPTHLAPRFLEKLMHEIQSQGISLPVDHRGTAKLLASADEDELTDGQSSSDDGKVAGASEEGWLLSQWRDGIFVSSYDATFFADSSGGSHSGGGHTGSHRFQGVNAAGSAQCLGQNNCFASFRISDDRTIAFGQPAVVVVVRQSLRTLPDGRRGPWELNTHGTVTMEGMGGGKASLRMVPDADGAALSQALVYYHRLGDWREQPNFFGPFWRAKLHPMSADQARQALVAAGATDAAQLTGLTGIPLD